MDCFEGQLLKSNDKTFILLSIVIPTYNEEGSIVHIAEEIDRTLEPADYRWETVWVDDGSTDGSFACMKCLRSPHRYIRLDTNHGQSAALMAGVAGARGEWIGTLDGDGQNDPADLPRLLECALKDGVDMVNGVRTNRRDGLIRRLSSRIANYYRRRALGDGVTDVGCSTRVVRRRLLTGLPFFHGMHRYLPALVTMRGGTMTEMLVKHRPRISGRSKYGINNRLWMGLRDVKGVQWLISRHKSWKVIESGGAAEKTQKETKHA